MIFFFCLFFLGLMPQAQAVDYQALGIEYQQTKEIIKEQMENHAQATSDTFEEEKKTISNQMAIITGDEDTKYIIVPGDTLKVVYSDQGNMVENTYQVNSDGMIALPLIGGVKVNGMNRGQAREHLNELMSEYIRNPQLSIQINTSGKYTVLGAAGPGVFELQPNLRLMEALIRAGVQQSRANLANVLVMRPGKDKPQVLRLNVKKMMKSGDRSDDILIKPNDLIYVPNTFFFDFEQFKDKLFEYIADYYTLGGATILKPKQETINLQQ
ncbi:MAG: polysaccharide biosynthesis/export family protein [Candidatus Omnitrophica bacterium]|nr:polysaccharide biosynthesis/export family protein [Candidatus Omnitrophota bacterium]